MSEANTFKAWELEWTAEHIQRFWNWLGTNPALEHLYFSRQVGDSILDEVRRYIPLSGVVVDLGAGRGDLVEKLIRRRVKTWAVDVSTESVAALNDRLKGNPYFLGARASAPDRLPLDDSTADLALLIETVEHLGDDVLKNLLTETRRIVKPGGCVAVTTPNEEILAEHQIMCPNCGCVFHTVQHMRSLSAGSMRTLMSAAGFTEIVCRPTLFSVYPRLLRPLQRLKYLLKRMNLPHLLYISRR